MKLLFSLFLLILTFSSCQQAPTHQTQMIWKPYSKKAIEESVSLKKPVVIDFFAEWCPVCHELDRTVFSIPEIQAKLAPVTALRMDATNQDDPEVQRILQEYNIDGLPTVLFLDSHGHEINNSRIEGLASKDDFDQALAMLKLLK